MRTFIQNIFVNIEILHKIAWSEYLQNSVVAKVLIMMSAKFHVDRHFLFLHGRNLAVFAERVLRKTHSSLYVPKRDDLWDALNISCDALSQVLSNPQLKRKERTEAVREREAMVLMALGRLAEYIESAATCKSDVFTTGFRPHAEHRKLIEEGIATRRRQRVSAKMARLVED